VNDIKGARAALRSGKPAELIGLAESGWLDVKGGIYDLSDRVKADELAKDVAEFANAETGGLLLVGFGTRKDHDQEIIDELRPVPRALVDLDRHRKLIRERVLPPPRNLTVEWIDCGNDTGVLMIDVPAQPLTSMPHVVSGPARGRDSVAVPMRDGDGTQWLQQAEMQRLLAAGWTGQQPAVPTAVPRLPVRLASRPAFLAGRDERLAELEMRLANGDGVGPRTVALCGMGGTGKTSVALEYAHRHVAEMGVAWQFPAEDPEVLRASFGELAAQLGAQDPADTANPVPSVHAVLARFPSQWLLIFDNAADKASIAEYQPPAGSGQVLITSQNQNWPGQALDVPVLDCEVAAGFLVSRSGDADRQAAAKLARELDGLPLALEQAGAYVQVRSGTLADYLAAFQQRRLDLLERGEPTLYGKTVATTWSLAFEQLEKTEPSSVGLLRLLACCAPDALPLGLLLQPRPGLAQKLDKGVTASLVPLLEDPLAAGDAIASLRRYSLATLAADGLVSVHRLVQAVTADQMPADLAEWRQAAAALIEAAIPSDSRLPQTWPLFAKLLPHAEKALAPGSTGVERIAGYLGNSGSYTAARDLQQKVLETRERILIPEHQDTLTARRNLACWTGWAGDAAEALRQDEELLPVIVRVRGPEDPDTLAACADIAHWTRKARGPRGRGREHPGTLAVPADRPPVARHRQGPKRAVALYCELLPEVQRIQGPEHLDTLAVRVGLAWSTGEAKDTAEARNQFADLLPVVERVLGPEDPLTLDVRAGLARWTGSAYPAGALDQFVALLPAYQQILRPGHPATLYIRHSIARWTGQAGDPIGARDQYAALLSERERILGPEHPDTRVARNNLAYWANQADSEED
jgi:hypothetical protein